MKQIYLLSTMKALDWNFIISVVFSGMAIVFAILILLVFIMIITGKISQASNKTNNDNNFCVPSSSQTNDISSNNVVAAITAAISVMLSKEGKTPNFIIKSIRKTSKKSSAWADAAKIENTTSFK